MSTINRAADLERFSAAQHVKRHRMRKAGFLQPLPVCPRCGAKCTNDRWLPLCALCARAVHGRTRKARPVRLAAEQIIRELRGQP